VNLKELKEDTKARGSSQVERSLKYVDKDYDELVKKD
jgi:hypothetical protein